jgi:argininosuccinate lyase
MAATAADPNLRATDAAEQRVREGAPFRDAHEEVAAQVRSGTFEAPAVSLPRIAPGPVDVAGAVAAARVRLGL